MGDCVLSLEYNEWLDEFEGVCLSCYDGAPYYADERPSEFGLFSGSEAEVLEWFEQHLEEV